MSWAHAPTSAHLPADVATLARLACTEAPRLLGRFASDHVGLLLVHPDSDACPDLYRQRGQAFFAVEPLKDLQRMARDVGLEAAPRPGWFVAVLVGATHTATTYLAPAAVAARRAC